MPFDICILLIWFIFNLISKRISKNNKQIFVDYLATENANTLATNI